MPPTALYLLLEPGQPLLCAHRPGLSPSSACTAQIRKMGPRAQESWLRVAGVVSGSAGTQPQVCSETFQQTVLLENAICLVECRVELQRLKSQGRCSLPANSPLTW